MAWNQPGGEQGGKPRKSARAVAGTSLLRRWRQHWSANPQARGSFYLLAVGVALLLWALSGFYQVGDGERGVAQRFGAYAGLRDTGIGWHLPWPIDTVTTVNLGKLNSADFQSRMFTSDAMLVNVTASIQYQYADPRAVLFAMREPDVIVREVGEAVARELVGQRRIEELMGGASRAPLTVALRSALQQPLDAMGAGIRVLNVNLTDVQVPEAVLGSQRELVQAGVERERMAREAQGYAAELVPAAQGSAQQQRLAAQTYKLQAIGVAEGDAARFEPIAAAYARAPQVTRSRLYIETMETILARSRKVIIDGKGGSNTLVLPLDKLSDPGALRAAGVTGIANGEAAATTPSISPAVTPPIAPAAVPVTPDDRTRDRERQ